MSKINGKNNDDYLDSVLGYLNEGSQVTLISLGITEIDFNREDGEYIVINTKTGHVVFMGPELIDAILHSQNEANAWSSLCETKRVQDTETKTGILLPQKEILTKH